MTQGIYKLINNKNNKVYIGSSKNIENRFKEHISMLKNCTHHSYKLQRFYIRHCDDEHFQIKFIILEEVEDNKKLKDKEQYYLDLYDAYNNGYNCTSKVDNPKYSHKNISKNKKKLKINTYISEYEYLINKYKDNLYLQYGGYNDTYLYRVNEAIKFFINNFNRDDYVAEILQYKSNVTIYVINKYNYHVRIYKYNTKYKQIILDSIRYKHMQKHSIYTWNKDRYKKFNNIIKSKNRFKSLMYKFSKLDDDILKNNIINYNKNKYAIQKSFAKEYIDYKYNDFNKHILDLDIKKLAQKYNISFEHGKIVLNL